MRLDARNGDSGWAVWDCRKARSVDPCLWVDDVLAQYGAWATKQEHLDGLLGGLEPPVHQCERIAIITDSRLVLIDPVADEEKDLFEVAISRPVPLDA